MPARSRLLVALALVVAACARPEVAPAASQPAPTASQANVAAAALAVGYLVPVTAFTFRRDDVGINDLSEVLVPASYERDVRALLPAARVLAVAPDTAVLSRVRASQDAIALVPAELVDPSLKTLSIDGQFFWDPALDPSRYPLRVSGRAGGEVARERLWELVAAGEIVFGRGVQERIETRHGGDARAAFARVRDVTRAADLAVATLEAPLSGERNRWCQSCMEFVGNERYVGGVSDAGFDVLSLAANHIGDGGARGVLDTLRVLDAAGLAHVGAGADRAAAHRPAILEVRGARVAFLGYTDVPPREYVATESRPGHAWLSHDDPTYAALRREIAAARDRADLVVVLPHWGIEYEDHPRPYEQDAARAMIDAGASVVIGDHPHWVQSVELYHGGYIAYGVGNFVFDQMWSLETREGSLQRLFFLGKRLVSVRILPTLIEDYYQPRLLEPSEPQYRETLERIWRHSSFDDDGR